MQENLDKSLDAFKSHSLKEIEGVAVSSFKKSNVPEEIKWVISNDGGKLKIKKEISLKKKELTPTNNVNNPASIVNLSSAEKNRETAVTSANPSFLFGWNIDMKPKIKFYQEGFRKNYVLSKSHNMLVAAFAKMKAGFYAGVLSFLGMKTDELEEIKKEAKESEISGKKKLFEENEYTAELLAIMGGSKKQIKKQKVITDEIRNQIIKQFENWGMKGLYTKEKIIEIQIEQCSRILEKFNEEKSSLDYQLAMFDSGISFGGDASNREEIMAKLAKIDKYINKAQQRIASNQRALELIAAKERQSVENFKTAKESFLT